LPLRLDDRRGIGFRDDGRSGYPIAGPQRLAKKYGSVVRAAAAVESYRAFRLCGHCA